MRKKLVMYMVLGLGIAIGYLPLSSWLFRQETAEAQCVRYWLSSGTSSGVSCPGGSNVSEVMSATYGTDYYVALCISN